MAPIRLLLVAVFAAGCTSGGPADTDTDTDTDPDPDTDPIVDNSSAARLGVPEQFRHRWTTTAGCETETGPGAQVYWHTDDAASVEDGEGGFTLTATETWYWFNGDDSPADCKDVWKVTGTYTPERQGCETCEEAYSFVRTLEEDGCRVPYHRTFAFPEGTEPPDPQVYEGYLLFDTHSEFDGSPFPGNALLIIAAYRRPDGQHIQHNNYSTPAMSTRTVDDPTVAGPPGVYEWVGHRCLPADGRGT